jgi:hypothetical protein
MSDAICTKYGCDYQLDLDGQVTCSNCGAMDDDMLPIQTYSDIDPDRSMRLKLVIEEMLKDIDMSGEQWNDRDKNGIPYWEKGRETNG